MDLLVFVFVVIFTLPLLTLPMSDRLIPVMVMNSKSEKVSDFTSKSNASKSDVSESESGQISDLKGESEQISDLKGDVPVYVFAIMSLVNFLLLSVLEMPVCLNSNDKVVPVEDSVDLWISDS